MTKPISRERWIIYRIVCRASGKSYIGLTGATLKCRWRQHRNAAARNSRTVFHKAIRKYGEDTFSASIYAATDSLEKAKQAERQAIREIRSRHPDGYNFTDGGDGARTGFRHSTETRRKMSAAAKGKAKSPEHAEKCRLATLGRKLSDAHKVALKAGASRANRGRKHAAVVVVAGQISRRHNWLLRKTNGISGFVGVYPHREKWRARITQNGTRINLGTFATPEEASAVYRGAAQRHLMELSGQNAVPSPNEIELQP